MKNIFRSHFVYTRNQRNGIFCLLVLIIALQSILFFVDFDNVDNLNIESQEVVAFNEQIDSLKQIAIEERKPKIYPFNPNFISDYKGYQLGMSTEEIDRLHAFREKKRFVNSVKEFQQVTKVSDSLLNAISTYFKFPDWVHKKTLRQAQRDKQTMTFNHEVKKETSLISTTDINNATLTDFLAVEGVNENISERIIKYRTKLQGFVFPDQIYEVWGLDKPTGDQILQLFSVQSIPQIKKLNINTASFKEVLKIPYIDYELCVKIFDYRDEVAELQSITELKNIKDFPMDKYDRIVVYLQSE